MRYVVIGNGVAGTTAAIDLARRETGEVVIYTAEPHPFYFRPRLPHFVAGEVAREDLYARSLSWYQEKGIEVHLGSPVVDLMCQQKRIRTADGAEVPYDRLLLATGGVPFIPPIEGVNKRGVFTLRTLDDARAIREYAARCQEAVVIGGGLLGLETARGLKVQGLSVTALEFFPRLCPRQLDQEGADVFQGMIERLGIEVGLSAETQVLAGDDGMERVILKDGREFPAQMVVIATGVRPDTELAASAGLETDRGVVVDEHMVTSAPAVYCAGDAASFQGRSWGIIPVAQAQARVAAANMAGEESVYEEVVPSTTLKIVGIELTSVGEAIPEDNGFEEIRYSDPEAGVYRKLVLRQGTLVGAIIVGDKESARELERLVTRGVQMDRQEARELLENGPS